MSPDEVRKLDNKKCLIFVRGYDPVLDDKYRTYEKDEFRRATAMGPYKHHFRMDDLREETRRSMYLDSPEESMKRLFEVDMGPLWMDRSLHRQVMFASNGPRFRQFKLIRGLDKIQMRDYAREGLYFKNALRFLGGDER